MSLLLESAVEASLILLLAWAAMPLLRGQPAALRHAVLALALVCCALAPAVGRALPPLPLPATVGSVVPYASSFIDVRMPGSAPPVPPSGREREPGRASVPTSSSIARALAVVWTAGAACTLTTIVLALARMRRLARAARPVGNGPWANAAAGMVRPRWRVSVLQGTHPSLLVTWGFLRPQVLLPVGAAAWPDDRIRVTLCHELAHVRRRDWLVLIAAETVKALYWYNPLVWLACGRLREEAEQACDDAVIASGVGGAEYASHLVNIARELKPQGLWLPAHGIARSSSFERRIRAMLDPGLNRRPVSRATYAVLGLALVVVSVSIAAAQQRLSTVSGAIADPMHGTLPGVTLVLTNATNESKYEVRTDASGRYEFVGVPAGDYLFEARLPGFSTFKGKITVTGEDVQRDLTMELGSLQETITVSSGQPVLASAPPTPRARRPLPDCSNARPADGRAFVGGNVRPPWKLVHVRPVYPAHLAAAGVHGSVTLKGRIGTDGRVENLTVVSSAHQDFAAAAIDAVSRWEFDETLLNCTPVAIGFTAVINFELEKR